jgi:hypothetical protein
VGLPEIAVARPKIEINRDKLRAAIHTLGTEYVVHKLGDAIDLLPPAKLHAVVSKYVDLRHKVLVEARTQRAVAREPGLSRAIVGKYVDQAAPARTSVSAADRIGTSSVRATV